MSDLYGTISGDGQDSTAKFDRAELVRGWREYEARTPRVVPLLKFSARTDMGQVRENNEDKFDFYEPELPGLLAARGCLYAVADGIGGAQAGQIASELMLKQVIAGYYDHPAPDMETALRESIWAANDRIFHLAQMIPERNGMGTTLVGVVFQEDAVTVVHVGDSRAFLIRNGEIRQATTDHSWVEEQVQAGMLTRQEAERSPFRNVITRSIGAAPVVDPEFSRESVQPGDIWVLCSDGLTGHVGEAEILQIAGHHAPSEASRQLIELANARGGHDNVTVFVVAVRDLLTAPNFVPSPSAFVNLNGSAAPLSAVVPSASDTGKLSPDLLAEVPASTSATQQEQRSGLRKLFNW